MEAYLREWRQSCLNRHQYDSAIWIADKLLALTSQSLNNRCHELPLILTYRQRPGCLLARSSPLLNGKLHSLPLNLTHTRSNISLSILQIPRRPLLHKAKQIRTSIIHPRRTQPYPPRHHQQQQPPKTSTHQRKQQQARHTSKWQSSRSSC
jgi:hypothetical protein